MSDFNLVRGHLFARCFNSYSTSGGRKSIFLLTLNMIAYFIDMNHHNGFSFIKFKLRTDFILWIRLYSACYNIGYFSKYFINFVHTDYNAIIFYTNKNRSTCTIKELLLNIQITCLV